MCNVEEDNFEERDNLNQMTKDEKNLLFGNCNKCREENPIIVLRTKDKYCQKCFLAGTVHKFKALLGKHKAIRPNDRVLIIYRCGHPTTALLHFIRTGLDLDTHKKLRFEPVVLFVNEHLNLPLKVRQELTTKIEKEVTSYNFPIFFTSITQITANQFNKDCVKIKPQLLYQDDQDRTTLENYLGGQISVTSKNDFLDIKRRHLWIDVARYLKCKFVFSTDISNDTASKILADLCLGRGSQIPLDSSFCDTRDEEIKILRPLRLFDAKELAFYNHLNNLEPNTFESPEEKCIPTVQNLIEKFVNNLQENYPATVTTVLKTGDKLSVDYKSRDKCDFCKAPIEEQNKELSSAESTQFSHWVSTHTLDYNISSHERYNKVVESFKNVGCENYCFACQKLHFE